jgi:UPF0716 protein FxsA
VFFFGALLLVAIEVAAFVAVGAQIGFGWALLLLIGVSALGPFVIKRVGIGVLARAQDRLNGGELPTGELLDGVVVLVGGLMICVPGFISDGLGLLLMIGPVRHLAIRVGGLWLGRRVVTMHSSRWTVIDVGSQPATRNAPTAPGTSGRTLGPGEGAHG